MGNSASDHLNEAPEKLVFFRISGARYNSDYGIYNSTGQLLKGKKLFEQYTELATRLDTKRSAFYLESKGKNNEIIFGCSLSVKADNGREERVVFIQIYKNLPLQNKLDSDIRLLKRFYEKVKFEVENLDVKKYRLVGLWDESDFRNIKDVPIEADVLEYTAGKVHAGKQVSVKISELSSGLSLVLKLIDRLRHRSTFTLDVSQYPSESDVSVSLIKPNPDFELGENGVCHKFIKSGLWNSYKELGEEIFKDENSSPIRSQNQPDYVNPLIKKLLREPISSFSSSNLIFDDFNNRDKIEIFQGLIQKANDTNDTDIKKILMGIYRKIKAPESRYELHRSLLSEKIYIEWLIKDLVITICKEHDTDLFNLLFSNKTSLDNSSTKYSANKQIPELARNVSKKSPKYDSFKKGIKNALKNLEYSEKVNFVKFIASEAPSNPKAEGQILLKNLIEDLVKLKGNNNFILKLSEEEVENLDEILGTNFLDAKKRLKKRNRIKFIKKSFYTCAFLVVIILMSYILIFHTYPIGNEGENNSSSNNTGNSSISDNLIDHIPNITKLFSHKTESISDGNISSSDNQNVAKNDTAVKNDTKNETFYESFI